MAETPETPDIRLLAIFLMIEICPGFSALGTPGCPGFSPSTRAWISRPRAFRAASALTNRSGYPSARRAHAPMAREETARCCSRELRRCARRYREIDLP